MDPRAGRPRGRAGLLAGRRLSWRVVGGEPGGHDRVVRHRRPYGPPAAPAGRAGRAGMEVLPWAAPGVVARARPACLTSALGVRTGPGRPSRPDRRGPGHGRPPIVVRARSPEVIWTAAIRLSVSASRARVSRRRPAPVRAFRAPGRCAVPRPGRPRGDTARMIRARPDPAPRAAPAARGGDRSSPRRPGADPRHTGPPPLDVHRSPTGRAPRMRPHRGPRAFRRSRIWFHRRRRAGGRCCGAPPVPRRAHPHRPLRPACVRCRRAIARRPWGPACPGSVLALPRPVTAAAAAPAPPRPAAADPNPPRCPVGSPPRPAQTRP